MAQALAAATLHHEVERRHALVVLVRNVRAVSQQHARGAHAVLLDGERQRRVAIVVRGVDRRAEAQQQLERVRLLQRREEQRLGRVVRMAVAELEHAFDHSVGARTHGLEEEAAAPARVVLPDNVDADRIIVLDREVDRERIVPAARMQRDLLAVRRVASRRSGFVGTRASGTRSHVYLLPTHEQRERCERERAAKAERTIARSLSQGLESTPA